MDDMVTFMRKRQNAILDGKMGHDSEKCRDSYFVNGEYRQRAHAVALLQAEADRSNPFAFRRVISLCEAGTFSPYDWSAAFGKERREGINPLTVISEEPLEIVEQPREVVHYVKVPHNASRP